MSEYEQKNTRQKVSAPDFVIGGIGFICNFQDESQRREALASFCELPPQDAFLTIVCNILHSELPVGVDSESRIPVVSGSDGMYHLVCAKTFQGTFDATTHHAELTFSSMGPRLNTAIWTLLSIILPWHGGLLFHSAALRINDKGYLFMGQSGAGKTTASNLAFQHGADVLSDELSIVRFVNNKPVLFSTPFWGESTAKRCHESTNLSMVANLCQAPAVNRENVPLQKMVQHILKNIVHYSSDEKLHKKILDLAFELASKTTCINLMFTRYDNFGGIL